MRDSRRVLIVTDSDRDYQEIVHALGGGGLNLDHEWADSAEAMRRALDGSDWDVIIADCQSSSERVRTAIELVRERDLDVPVLVVSSKPGEQIAVDCMRAGAHDYITKRDFARLAPIVKRELRDVEQRRTDTEQALRRSQTRYRAVFENTGTATCLVEEDRTISLANERFAAAAGYPREQIEGRMKYTDFAAPRERERMKQYHRRRREEGGSAPKMYEFDFVNREGETRRMLLNVDMIPGTMTSVASMLDITERIRSEEALRESEERFRTLADLLPQIVFETDAEGTLTFTNRNALETMGYTADELRSGLTALEMIAPRDRARAADNVEARLRGVAVPQGNEYLALRKDGSRFPVLVYASPVIRGGEPVGLRGIMIDISERKQAEEEIRRLSQFREAAIDQATIWLNVLDIDGNVLIWNRAAEQISGYSASEAVGGKEIWQRIVPDPEEGRRLSRHYALLARDESVMEDRQVMIRTRAGEERIVSWDARAISGESGEPIGVIALGRDITEQHELERQLRQAQKMEAVGQLAGGIAHDFNNMLAVILGNAQLMAEKVDDDYTLEHLQQIIHASMHSQELIRQLLVFSRQSDSRPASVNLTDLVEKVRPMLERVIPENIRVRVQLSNALDAVKADAAQLEQVLMNLCINARDAMPDGGELVIATEMTEVSECYAASHPGLQAGRHASLIVSDTGTGMDEERIERIFDPFFTTKRPGDGAGLGLSIAYGIVNQCGGFIDVDSTPGEGTTFVLHFPPGNEAANEHPPESDEQADIGACSGGKETILVVEDVESLRKLMHEALTLLGYEVMLAENGRVGMELIKAHRQSIDLVLTDVVMPEMSGPEMVLALGDLEAIPPVLFISGYADRCGEASGPAVPADAPMLQKPFTPSAMVAMIREILDERGGEESAATASRNGPTSPTSS